MSHGSSQSLTHDIDEAIQNGAAGAGATLVHAGHGDPLVEERVVALALVKGAHSVIPSNRVQVTLERRIPQSYDLFFCCSIYLYMIYTGFTVFFSLHLLIHDLHRFYHFLY